MTEKIRSVYDLMAREWGVKTQAYHNRDASDADIADKIIAKNNPGRLALSIINLGGTAVFVAPQGPASSTRGIRLNANGGFVNMNWRDDGARQSYEWHAQCAADDNALFISEDVII